MLDVKQFVSSPGTPTVTPQATSGGTSWGYKIVARGQGTRETNASAESKNDIRDKFDDGGFLIELARVCDYNLDQIRVSSSGRVSAEREWMGSWNMITPSWWYCTVNDGWHINAALADYFFWWAHRLYDYVREGLCADTDEYIRFSVMAWLCAKAGLSEIVDISANLLHEFSHATGWPASWWECQWLWGLRNLECCHYNLEWFFRRRMYAEHALPISILADNAFDPQAPVPSDGPDPGSNPSSENRFDFDSGVRWEFTFRKSGGGGVEYCDGAQMTGVHSDLWTSGHSVTLSWSYPEECTSSDSTDSEVITS